MQNAQGLLTVWEGEKIPVHRSKKGLTFANVVNKNDSGKDAAGDGSTQESSSRAAHWTPTAITIAKIRDTGAEDHFFFLQMVKNFRNILNSWLLLDSE